MSDDKRYKRGKEGIDDFFDKFDNIDKKPAGSSPRSGRAPRPSSVRPNGTGGSASRPGRSASGREVRRGGEGLQAAQPGGRASGRSAVGRSAGSSSGRSASGRPNGSSSGRSANGRSAGGLSGRSAGDSSGRFAGGRAAGDSPVRSANGAAGRPSGKPAARRKSGRTASDRSANTNNSRRRSGAGRAEPARRGAQQKAGRRYRPEVTRGTPGRFGRDHKGIRKRSKHPVLKSIVTIVFILVLAALAAGVLYVYGAIKDLETPDPKVIEANLKVSSTMYDSSGKVIKNLFFGEGQREMATYDQLPENLKNAIIAIEDKTFETHHGFNFIRIVGALRDSLMSGSNVGGTSTITQQLARNIFLPDTRLDYDYKRKIQEAYYAVQLENNLSKEEILTDYLNTISLGYHSLGVSVASKNYFDKKVEDLDLLECAALASLPKSPTGLAMITTADKGTVEEDDPNLLLSGKVYDYLYNDAIIPRIKLVLANMLEQGKITQSEHDAALKEDLREHLHPKEIVGDSEAAFFVNWAIDNVAENLMKEYSDKFKDIKQAKDFIYTSGLQIHSTYNRKMQKIAVDEMSDPGNYPDITYLNRDDDGNMLDDKGNIQLYKYSNIIGSKGRFTFRSDEATMNADGSMTIYKGMRMNIYSTTVDNQPDVSIEFKNMYLQDDDGTLYKVDGGVVNIPQGYKTVDGDGNCVVSAEFFQDHPDFIKTGEKIVIPRTSYTLKQKVIQPQGAAVLLDHRNGRVFAMVGGRDVEGEMNFNRTLEPRQPGSCMKPIGTYGPAIQMSAEKEEIEDGEKSFGKYWSPLSVIVDEEFKYKGKVWPKNWYGGYRGPTTLRKSVEQSANVNAVKVQLSVGADRSVDFLHKLGITTLVEEGRSNDLNPAALALGGMTNGATPIEMAAAYGAFANAGTRVEPIAYTEVVDRNGNVVLDGTTEKTKAMDPGTAFIMNDIMRTVVTNGIGGGAGVSGVPVSGKTGTTSENFDAWFVGNTPKLSMSIWFGCDVNIELTEGSGMAARTWSKIMTRVMDGRSAGEFPAMPDNVVRESVSGMTDYFIKGTKPSYVQSLGNKQKVKICNDSGYRATKWCPNTSEKTYSSDGDGNSGSPPRYWCNLHNSNPGQYPIDPDKSIDKNFDPKDPDGSKKKKEEEKKKKEEEDKPTPETTPEPTPEPTPDPVPPPATEPTPTPATPSGGAVAAAISQMPQVYGAMNSGYYDGPDIIGEDILKGRYLLNYYIAQKLGGRSG